MNRRTFLKWLATVPIVSVFALALRTKKEPEPPEEPRPVVDWCRTDEAGRVFLWENGQWRHIGWELDFPSGTYIAHLPSYTLSKRIKRQFRWASPPSRPRAVRGSNTALP